MKIFFISNRTSSQHLARGDDNGNDVSCLQPISRWHIRMVVDVSLTCQVNSSAYVHNKKSASQEMRIVNAEGVFLLRIHECYL